MSNTYTTVQGDTWDGIAHAQMGNGMYMDRLMWANREYMNYFILPAGITLTIPEIKKSVSSKLPPWKRGYR